MTKLDYAVASGPVQNEGTPLTRNALNVDLLEPLLALRLAMGGAFAKPDAMKKASGSGFFTRDRLRRMACDLGLPDWQPEPPKREAKAPFCREALERLEERLGAIEASLERVAAVWRAKE